MIRKISKQWCLVSIGIIFAWSAHAMPTNEVIFEAGSNCGNFAGDLTQGGLFQLELEDSQQLEISTDGHVQSVIDSSGQALQDKGGINYSYESTHNGTHTVKMVGRANSKVEFCVR